MEISSGDSCVIQQLNPIGYYREFIKNGVRLDGRGFSDLRRIAVGAGDSSTSSGYGSSLVHIGETKVACSISVLVGTPSQQHPDCGDIDFDVSLWPLCNLKYDLRSKSDESYLLEQLLNELVTKGRLLDLAQLGIERGRFAYRLSVKVMCISEDGNLTDSAILAVIRALMDVKLPKAVVGDTVAITAAGVTPLVLLKTPISVTLGLFDDIFIVDPSQKEEEIMRGKISCAIAEDGTICLMNQRTLSGKGISHQQFQDAVTLCRRKADEIRAALGN